VTDVNWEWKNPANDVTNGSVLGYDYVENYLDSSAMTCKLLLLRGNIENIPD
jgi:hypothetical protein